jgi:BASS family bile acid:Na+ symporter
LLIFAAVAVMNGLGYLLGYWAARLFGLNEESRRTIAFDVAMQNSGLTGGIAAALGQAGTMGLASVLWSSWHNVSGSILANWWRNRPPEDQGLTAPAGANERVSREAPV